MVSWRWLRIWSHVAGALMLSTVWAEPAMFDEKKLARLRSRAEQMFDHAWSNYMDRAFPADELRPLTCQPLLPDKEDRQLSDVVGGFPGTLIDTLDTLAIMNRTAEFHSTIDRLTAELGSFDLDSSVHVFETTIRMLGGLLSAHLYASVPSLGQAYPGYNGSLLHLAHDLGLRLLPAFQTPTGIPHPRVNLRRGVVPEMRNGLGYITETCSAAAGSLVLEFGLLSRLTGDQRFEKSARRAFLEVWSRRSTLDLVAMSLDSKTGKWLSPITGVGASIDSYYEYAVKYYVLFGDKTFYSIFERMMASLYEYAYNGWTFSNINFNTGMATTGWIDSLGAFFPGLLVLSGRVQDAVKLHVFYYKLWNTYGGIPERWTPVHAVRKSKLMPDFEASIFQVGKEGAQMEVISERDFSEIALEWWPLRPEFIESTYYLYQATKDALFLHIGEQAMDDIEAQCRTSCGYAGIRDVRTGELADRMESFFLSETAKYLYLLFDPSHALSRELGNFVFSTEGHPFWYDKEVIEHASVARFGGGVLPSSSYDDRQGKEGKREVTRSLWSKWYSQFTEKKPSRRRPPRPHNYTCEVWHGGWFGYSPIASWDHFYSLDEAYEYTVPKWREEHVRNYTFFDLYARDSHCAL